jgi:Arc/MetJ family transcription regulator
MRTNIDLDEALMKKAFRLSHVRTKKALVTTALSEFVSNHSRKDLRQIRGKIAFRDDYDYKSLRAGRVG